MKHSTRPDRPSTSRRSARRLARHAASIAASRGWVVVGEGPGETSRSGAYGVLVVGDGLLQTAELRVCECEGPDQAGLSAAEQARRAARSEYLLESVASLPARRVRGRWLTATAVEHPAGGSLRSLLEQPVGLARGAAATVLLGVASAMGALHDAGWAGVEPGPETIAFRANGCPVIRRMDGVKRLDPDGARADVEAFRAVARSVCHSVRGGDGADLLAAVEFALMSGRWHGVADAVLAIAEPVALPLPATASPAAGAPAATTERMPAAHADPVGRALAWLDGRPVADAAGALVAWVRERPKLIAIGSIPLVVALLVLLALPAPAQEARHAATASPRSTQAEAARASPVASPHPSAPPIRPSGEASADADPTAPTSEDPAAAAAALLERRQACFAAPTPRPDCLRRVVQPGTPLEASEVASLGQGGAAERDYDGAQVLLVERWGEAALVAVVPDELRTPHSRPASLLLVRSEAGWRLRAVIP